MFLEVFRVDVVAIKIGDIGYRYIDVDELV